MSNSFTSFFINNCQWGPAFLTENYKYSIICCMERIDDLNINGLRIIQNTDYFLFGIDSVILANNIKLKKQDVMLDLCTGTGVIPIIVDAKQKCKKILGIELQKEMYDLAERNIQMNNLSERISILNMNIKDIKAIRKYLLKCTGKDTVNCISCNPPYKQIGTGIKINDSVKDIARNEVECTLEDVFKTASALLNSKGKLYLVHKPERIADLLCYSRKYNLEIKEIRFMQPQINKKPSLVLLEYIKDGGVECNIREILVQYDKYGNYSEEIMSIYKEV